MLDGASRIGDVVAAAAADGQPAVGITDHGNMYGVLPMYTAAREAGVKPVLGMEGYFTNMSRFDRPKRSEHEIYHLTMLAETNEGYRNLIKVTSQRVPRRLLLQAAQRLGPARAPSRGHHRHDRLPRRARLAAHPRRATRTPRSKPPARFQDIFGRDHFFVELQDHGIDGQTSTCSIRCSTSRASSRRRCSRPTTATTRTSTTPRRTTRCCACRPARCKTDAKRFKFDGDDFYIKSAAEMRDLFRELPDACDNTLLIAERADVEIEFGQAILPSFPVPEGHDENSLPARAHDGRRQASATARRRRRT